MRILIVEDEEALSEGLKFNFEQEGYAVVLAGDGPTALKRFQDVENPVDIVILDLMLPGMSGYETCRAIRVIDDLVPILTLSARSMSEDFTMAFDAGTDQYMTKPFKLPELLEPGPQLAQPLGPHGPGAAADSAARIGHVRVRSGATSISRNSR